MVLLLPGCSGTRAQEREGTPPKIRDDHGFLITPGVTPTPTTPVPTPFFFVTPSPQGGSTPTPTGSEWSTLVNPRGYSKDEILSYFDAIAMSVEYGKSMHEVHKWTSPMKLYVVGSPTDTDRRVLSNVISKMNSVSGFPGISQTLRSYEANVTIYFYDDEAYDDITPTNITDRTDGFATCWFQEGSIFLAKIGIRTSMSQTERTSVIWEELVQCTGLQNDSYDYPDSLFYQGYNEVPGPNTLDWILFEVLYHPSIEPGMSLGQVSEAMDSFLR